MTGHSDRSHRPESPPGDPGPALEGRGRGPLAALAILLAVTAAWWALALWPVPSESPGWLVRTRSVCFGSTPDGLPDAEGWIALVLQPALMIGTLLAIWGREVATGLRRLQRSFAGNLALGTAVALVSVGIGAAGYRVVTAPDGNFASRALAGPVEVDPARIPRLDRPAPELGLVDQRGETVRLSDLRGGPAVVTFAYGHCETVCPMVVHASLAAREEAGRGEAPAAGDRARVPLVVVTLDPWRDTPARLPHLAERWELEPGDRVVGGSVTAVNAVLDAWNVPRKRDPRTGEITHPALVYVLDGEGRIAFASAGRRAVIRALLERI